MENNLNELNSPKTKSKKLIFIILFIVFIFLILISVFIYRSFSASLNGNRKNAEDIYNKMANQAADATYLASVNRAIPINIKGSMVPQVEEYKREKNTYAGFVFNGKTSVNNDKCKSELKIDISPDGTKYVMHQTLCGNDAKSFCYDNDSTEVVEVDTSSVNANYRCR
jgi:hypothetical protein